ncbi:MAG: DsbA family protein [Acidimicrobiales bacterium]|nr:DsbA family protein [Acidimicrobiales bacterium]
MTTIEVFADVRCPFTHVGIRRFLERRDAAGGGPTLIVRAWPLELVNDAPMDPAKIGEEIDAIRAQVAPDLFTAFTPERFAATSLPALELAAVAAEQSPELGEALAVELRWAHFEEGRDIGDPDVLADLAAAHGLTPPSPDTDLRRTRRDWAEGKARGVIGSPHFFVGGEAFFCPGLDISHTHEGFAIRPDVETFDRFIEVALHGPGPERRSS